MSFGKDDTQTVTQTQSLPSWVEAPAKDALASAAKLYQTRKTLPGLSPITNEAMSGIAGMAREGSPTLGWANDLIGSTLRGDFLNAGNPYFDRAVQSAIRPMVDSVTGEFSKAGRYGSGAMQDVLARNIGDITSQMAYQNYGDERGRQENALRMTPTLSDARFNDLTRLASVGQFQDARGLQEFNQGWENLYRFLGAINGNFGGSTINQQPIYKDPLAQGLGLLTAGLGMFA